MSADIERLVDELVAKVRNLESYVNGDTVLGNEVRLREVDANAARSSLLDWIREHTLTAEEARTIISNENALICSHSMRVTTPEIFARLRRISRGNT